MERDWNKVVFLAHAKENKDQVKQLYKKLKEAGLDPWMDEFDLPFGINWDVAIRKAIRKCNFFLACLSQKSINKTGYVQKELRFALDEFQNKPTNTIYFIPVLLEDMDLSELYIDKIALSNYHASRVYEKEGLEKLIQQLQKETKILNKVQHQGSTSLQEIRQQVAEGELKLALEQLQTLVDVSYPELSNNIILLKARQHRLFHEHNLLLIPHEEYQRESNRLVYAILETLDVVEEKQKG